MATVTLNAEQQARLEAVQAICGQIAGEIRVAANILRADNVTPIEDLPFLVAQSLDRLGWMADRASLIAGEQHPFDNTDGWILAPLVREAVAKVGTAGEASHA